MKRCLTILLIFAAWGMVLKAQERNEFMAGLNLAALPYRTVEPSLEYFPLTSISLELSGGYCFNRPYKVMRNVDERVKGGFLALGARFYFFRDKPWRIFTGAGLYYGNFRRASEVTLDHYYGTYQEDEANPYSNAGWSLVFGLQYRREWLVIQPALRATITGGRNDRYGIDYWQPGVGRAGLSNTSRRRGPDLGFWPLIQVKFAF